MFIRIGHGSTLWKGQSLELPWGKLEHEGSSVSISTTDQKTTSRVLEELAPFLEVHWTETYFIAGSAAGTELFLGTHEDNKIKKIAVLPRWDETAVFNPGVHAVRFFDIDEVSCLVSNEVCLAKISLTEGLEWSYHHGDTTQRVLSVSPDTASLMSLTTSTEIDVISGKATVQPLNRGK